MSGLWNTFCHHTNWLLNLECRLVWFYCTHNPNGTDSADVGHLGLCLKRCQIRVISGFGRRLAYCHFNSQIELLSSQSCMIISFKCKPELRLCLCLMNHTNLGLRTAENAAKILGWKEGVEISCLLQMNHPCGQKYNHLIMKFHMDSSQKRKSDYAAVFESIVYFLFLEMITLTFAFACRQILGSRDFTFISNFFIQTCFTTACHSNQLKKKLGLFKERMNNKNGNIFLHMHTFGSVKQCIFPVNEETFIALEKKKTNNPQTKQRKICPQAAVSHIPPPTSCLEYRHCVGCSEQRAISEGSSASIHYYKICHLPAPVTVLSQLMNIPRYPVNLHALLQMLSCPSTTSWLQLLHEHATYFS